MAHDWLDRLSAGLLPRPPMTPRLALSIDVDPIPCYYRIHALGPPPPALRSAIMLRCVPRFAELFERRGIRATFFVVAQDLDHDVLGPDAEAARTLLRDLAAAGHEIASHSYSHPYDMARLDEASARAEISRAHDLLSETLGDPPGSARGDSAGGPPGTGIVGFRAPGYDLSPAILRALVELGYTYDSSIFPAPGYYVAKTAVMAGLAALGRPSGAVLTDPRALLAPAQPYRPRLDAPWRRGDAPLIELPIAVTPYGRTPVIGTSLLLAPRPLRDHWLRAMSRRPFFNLELHGIDLADADADAMPSELVARQPDLRVPLSRKLAALEAILDRLAGQRETDTLRAITGELEATL